MCTLYWSVCKYRKKGEKIIFCFCFFFICKCNTTTNDVQPKENKIWRKTCCLSFLLFFLLFSHAYVCMCFQLIVVVLLCVFILIFFLRFLIFVKNTFLLSKWVLVTNRKLLCFFLLLSKTRQRRKGIGMGRRIELKEKEKIK